MTETDKTPDPEQRGAAADAPFWRAVSALGKRAVDQTTDGSRILVRADKVAIKAVDHRPPTM